MRRPTPTSPNGQPLLLGRLGGYAEPVTDRDRLIGTWVVFFDHSLAGRPPEEAFVYRLKPDGTCVVEVVGHGVEASTGEWRLNSDGTFSLLTWCPPMPEYGMSEPSLDEARYHIAGLQGGRKVLWNGDGSLVLLLSYEGAG